MLFCTDLLLREYLRDNVVFLPFDSWINNLQCRQQIDLPAYIERENDGLIPLDGSWVCNLIQTDGVKGRERELERPKSGSLWKF